MSITSLERRAGTRNHATYGLRSPNVSRVWGTSGLVLAGLLWLAAPAAATVYTYDNTTSGAVPFVSTTVDTNPLTECISPPPGTSPLIRTFTVSESFTVTTVGLGLNISHTSRDDIVAVLESPAGTRVVMLNDTSTDDSDNYDVYFVSNSEVSDPDDGDFDTVAAPLYHRDLDVNGLTSFNGQSSAGTWTVYLCDDTAAATGTFNSARLNLESAATASSICTSTATYDWGSNGQAQVFVSATFGDVTLSQVSTSDVFNNAVAGANFQTRTTTQGGDSGYYAMAMDVSPGDNPGDGGDESGAMLAVFSFDPPVRDLAFNAVDIDLVVGAWEDLVRVQAEDASGTLLPFNWTQISAATTEQIGELFEGDASSATTQNLGNVNFVFDGPVTTLRVEYFTGDVPEDPNQQVVGIGDLALCAYDFGDAPASYSTSLAGGARHVLGSRSLYLGAAPPDGESDGQPSAAASGDGADEDGVAAFPGVDLNPGDGYDVAVTVTNQSGSAATLCGWIDFDLDGPPGDGTFESDEGACVTVPAAGSSNASCTEGASGVFTCTVSFVAPADFVYVPGEETLARFRVTTDSIGTGDFSGRADDGEVEDFEVPADTLPVTLASLSSRLDGDQWIVRWTTANEVANAGFRLWGRSSGSDWTLLATEASKARGMWPAEYELAVAAGAWDELALEDIDFGGRGRWHGPFAVGGSFGRDPEVRAIDWSAVRAAAALPESAVGRVPAAMRAPAGQGGLTSGRLLVSEAGIHRVTHQELLAAGIDLTGVAARTIAVRDRGGAVARHVEGGPSFGPGSYVEWLAEPQLTLASPFDVYEIAVDPAKALPAIPGQVQVDSAPLAEHRALRTMAPDRAYSFASPLPDPWYDQGLISQGGAPRSLERVFDLPALVAGRVDLTVDLWGSSDWPGTEPDHHFTLSLNGQELESVRFDGVTAWRGQYEVASLVTEVGNVLELTVVGDTGFSFDLVNFEGFTVEYPARTVAEEGRWSGSPQQRSPYAVQGLPAEPALVWTRQGGQLVRREAVVDGGEVLVPGGDVEAWISVASALLRPEIAAGIPAAAEPTAAEYLIITHPVFAGDLASLVSLQEARGLTVETVTVDAIWARGSDHAADPEALRGYIADSAAAGPLRYVLLVGGDTFDPHDHLGLGSLSFVPTAYTPVGDLITFAPSDPLLADIDEDQVPDLMIGRLPVRTTQELTAMVEKLWAWEGRSPPENPVRSLLSAGRSDRQRELADVNDDFALLLGATGPRNSGWAPVESVATDDLGTAEARQRVLAAFDSGVPLISYIGHTTFGRWDFNPLLRWQDVSSMGNTGSPALVTQWGCWNSYFVSPQVHTMSDHLLLTGANGAAATIGSTTLTETGSHRLLGERFFARVGSGAETVGQALLAAQRELASEGRAQDAVLGMILLGDPAMPLD